MIEARRPKVALTKAKAAEALSMSVDSLERYVIPEIRVVRRGRLVLIAWAELERWLEANAARVFEEAR